MGTDENDCIDDGVDPYDRDDDNWDDVWEDMHTQKNPGFSEEEMADYDEIED